MPDFDDDDDYRVFFEEPTRPSPIYNAVNPIVNHYRANYQNVPTQTTEVRARDLMQGHGGLGYTQPVGIEAPRAIVNTENWGQAIQFDTYNDTVEVRAWQPNEYKELKNKKKIVNITKEAFVSITVISQELTTKYMKQLQNIYQKRVDNISTFNYTNLVELMQENEDHSIYSNFTMVAMGYDDLSNGVELYSDRHGIYLKALEEQALIKYDKNHSKYRFYPRLKDKVTYGNPELLAEILTVTRIGRGKVVCK